ncbi:hypothetical protein NIES2107_67800 [Nostoc carneum NIES-2107]|nr:hypothetical protein NIES2107_67800 [Nostoc carneum NIES-2107]
MAQALRHLCQLKLKAIYGECCKNTSRPHPLTPSPAGEGELNLLLPSPCGRGAGGEGETLQPRGFHVKLTPMALRSFHAGGKGLFPLLPAPFPPAFSS